MHQSITNHIVTIENPFHSFKHAIDLFCHPVVNRPNLPHDLTEVGRSHTKNYTLTYITLLKRALVVKLQTVPVLAGVPRVLVACLSWFYLHMVDNASAVVLEVDRVICILVISEP
jgi:hypothetical protein